ncbi:MAG: sulfotransferase [Novosphingobium sp.]
MIQVSQLVADAEAATGLSDFGADGWQEGLEILVDSANREARLNEAGRAMFIGQAVMLLSRRLEVEDWHARHPEIDEQEIVAPLMVLGLPRTGSTALHCLLGEDPQVRVMRNWESMSPCPPPERATYESDPRIAAMEIQMERRNRVTPRMKQMVPSSAISPTEDQLIMGHDFKSQIFQASFRIPGYVEWLNHRADLVLTFQYVKRVLKLLQWRCPPRRWRLKNPSYTLFIDALDRVFPDARYCMTHRDVTNVIPSVADLYFEMGRINTDDVDKAWIGAVTTESGELGMKRMIAFRDRGNDRRFFDIHFASFQKDPFPTIEKLYQFLGEAFTDEARERMAQWRRDTPRDKHGLHEYHPEEFGLDVGRLRDRFRFYADRFSRPVTA